MSTIKNAFLWSDQTARLLGWPLLLVLIFTCFTKFVFTGTCLSAGYQCQHAFGVSQMAQGYLTSLVGGDADIVVSKNKN